MSRESAVSVKIFNQTYRLATSQDRDAEYVQRAAAYLDEKMREASENADLRAPLDVAILAALNIAEEALAARERKEGLLDDTDARIHSFTQKLNEEHTPEEHTSSEDPPPSPPRF